MRRVIDTEARWGGPVNEFAARLYEWLFLFIGPIGIVIGTLFLIWGFWIGIVLVVIGVWMTATGYLRAWRWLARRRGARSL
jgi:hypothetical protein